MNPNYLYSWVRDASLVFKTIIDQYTTGQDLSLRTLIDDFVSAEAAIQQITNPSGTVVTGGLGEPKVSVSLPIPFTIQLKSVVFSFSSVSNTSLLDQLINPIYTRDRWIGVHWALGASSERWSSSEVNRLDHLRQLASCQ